MQCALVLAAALAAFGCRGATPDTGGSPGDTDGQPGDVDLPDDCSFQPDAFDIDDPSLADIETVAQLSWTAQGASGAAVLVYHPDDRMTEVPVAGAGPDFSAVVVGLKPRQDYPLVLVADTPDGRQCSEALTVTTGGLPAELPAVGGTATPDATAGYRLAPMMTDTASHMVVMDADGDVVWSKQVIEVTPGDDPEILYRLEALPDGSGLVFNTQGGVPEADGHLVRIGWTGEDLGSTPIPGGHTDFALLPEGGAAMLGWEVRTYEYEDETREILGNTLLEVDAGGTVREVWNVFDHVEPDLSKRYPTDFPGSETLVEDWSHVNSVHYDAATQTYFLTMEIVPSVISVDRATGAQNWLLSGKDGDFAAADPGLIERPHSAQPIDGGVLVFNRRIPSDSSTCSDVIEVGLDLDAMTAVQGWTYTGERCAQIGFLGNADRLHNGNTLVSWSHLGLIDEVDPNGDLVWQVSMNAGAGFGFVSHTESLQ